MLWYITPNIQYTVLPGAAYSPLSLILSIFLVLILFFFSFLFCFLLHTKILLNFLYRKEALHQTAPVSIPLHQPQLSYRKQHLMQH